MLYKTFYLYKGCSKKTNNFIFLQNINLMLGLNTLLQGVLSIAMSNKIRSVNTVKLCLSYTAKKTLGCLMENKLFNI